MHHSLRRVGAAFAALGIAALLSTPAGAATFQDTYTLPGSTVFPEGIAYENTSGGYFVSSSSDGSIFRGDVTNPTATVFLPGNTDGRSSATGLKVDRYGHLFVAGAATGRVFIYNIADGTLVQSFANNVAATFLNDIAISRAGDAYITDSTNPVLYKITRNSDGSYSFENWLDLTSTPIVYQNTGFNLNGIVITGDNKYLLTVQSNTGKLFRIKIATKEVSEVNLGGETLKNGDGMQLDGNNLYVVQNADYVISRVRLANLASRGVVSSRKGYSTTLKYPTTIALAQNDLLVVNSQFNKRGPGLTPDVPFTISRIAKP